MITLYSGMLGSGKSYKMVAELSRKKDDYFVVHNIEHLQKDYLGEFGVNWIEYCDSLNLDVSIFFSKEYQLEYSKRIFEKYRRPVLVIIDEAHEWFDHHVKTFKMWLSYSRHLDQEIWLVAHRSTNIPAIYRSFVSVEFRAKSGTFFNLPYFVYNRILGGERAGYTFEKKDKKIFALYKSKQIHNDKDKKSQSTYMLPVFVVIACLGVILFFWLPSRAMNHKKAVTVAPAGVKDEKKVISVEDVKAIMKNDSIEEKYAYAGQFNDKVVLEDRKTGIQIPIEKINNMIRVVTVDRDNSCTLMQGKRIFTVYNIDRHVIPVERVPSPDSPMFAMNNGSAGEVRHQSTTPAE